MQYWKLSRFVRFGFKDAGKCVLDKKLKSGVRFNVTDFQDKRVVYAFKINRQIKYVGICDAHNTTLKKRMTRYQSNAGAGNNKRLTSKIKGLLKSRHKISILAFLPQKRKRLKSLSLDLVKAFEYPLIDKIEDRWNFKR